MPIEKIRDMIAFATPIRIISRPERLIIQDYRPTMLMLLAGAGFVVFAGLSISLMVNFATGVDSFGFWVVAAFAFVCLAAATRGTIREVYVFDRTTDSYAFVRQFLYKRETIEGAMSQFTGAKVHTEATEESNIYSVVLRQNGMFLTGAAEQTLREAVPVMNTFSNEADIANAIDDFLHRTR